MTRKKIIWRIIFYSLFTVFFVIIATGIIFYARGYRYNFDTKKIEKTGMIYLDFYPTKAKVFFENKQLKRQKSPIKIKNLTTSDYQLRIEKEGFFTWNKKVTVKPERVNWNYIVLFPQNPEVQKLAEEASNFFLSPDDKKIAYINTNPENAGIYVVDIITKEQKKIFPQDNRLNPSRYIFEQLVWSPDNTKLLFIQKDKELTKSSIYIVNVLKPQEIIYLNELYPYDFEILDWIPQNDWISQNSNEIIAYTQQTIYRCNITTSQVPKVLAEKVNNFSLAGNKIYYIKKEEDKTSLWGTDYEGNNQNKILDLEGKDTYKLYSSIHHNNLAIYNEVKQDFKIINYEGNQYQINSQEKEVTDACWSQNGKKIFYRNNYEIWTFFIEKEEKKVFENNLVVRFKNKINKVLWHPDWNHLIFNIEDKIQICELDGENKIDFINISIPQFNLLTTGKDNPKKPILFFLNKEGDSSQINLYSVKLFKD